MIAFVEDLGSFHSDVIEKPTRESPSPEHLTKRSNPRRLVLGKEFCPAFLQGRAARIILAHPPQIDLHADELGAGSVALIVQPVGVNEPYGVIIRVLDNRLQESF